MQIPQERKSESELVHTVWGSKEMTQRADTVSCHQVPSHPRILFFASGHRHTTLVCLWELRKADMIQRKKKASWPVPDPSSVLLWNTRVDEEGIMRNMVPSVISVFGPKGKAFK